jgi:hypothetical protein
MAFRHALNQFGIDYLTNSLGLSCKKCTLDRFEKSTDYALNLKWAQTTAELYPVLAGG